MKSLIKKLSTLVLCAFIVSSPVFASENKSSSNVSSDNRTHCLDKCQKKDGTEFYNCYTDCLKSIHSAHYNDCSNSCYSANKCIDECGVVNDTATRGSTKQCTDCRNLRTQCQSKCKE